MKISRLPFNIAFDSIAFRQWLTMVTDALLRMGNLQRVLDATASLDFPQVAAQSTQTLTVSVPGAKLDATNPQRVVIRCAVFNAGLTYEGYVSADDTVTIVAINYSTVPINPPSHVFGVTVFQYV